MSIILSILLIIVILFIVNYILEHENIIVLNNAKKIDINENGILEQYYFQNYINLEKNSKKKIFIHIPYEKNERNWDNFYSRSSNKLNIDLCSICIKSVIYHCYNKYDIILYNNNNVRDLIKEQNEKDLCNIKNPNILSGVDLLQWENYCKSKILYKFGGIVMEPYFFFYNCPKENILFSNDLKILHHTNEGLSSSENILIPSINYFISSPRKNETLKLHIMYLEYICVHYYSLDNKHFDKTFEKLYNLSSYNPKQMGILDIHKNPVQTRDLLSKKEIIFDPTAFCLFINIPFLKKYTQYSWILKMNESQIKDSKTFIGAFIQQYS